MEFRSRVSCRARSRGKLVSVRAPLFNAWRRVSSAGEERMFVSNRRAQDDKKKACLSAVVYPASEHRAAAAQQIEGEAVSGE